PDHRPRPGEIVLRPRYREAGRLRQRGSRHQQQLRRQHRFGDLVRPDHRAQRLRRLRAGTVVHQRRGGNRECDQLRNPVGSAVQSRLTTDRTVVPVRKQARRSSGGPVSCPAGRLSAAGRFPQRPSPSGYLRIIRMPHRIGGAVAECSPVVWFRVHLVATAVTQALWSLFSGRPGVDRCEAGCRCKTLMRGNMSKNRTTGLRHGARALGVGAVAAVAMGLFSTGAAHADTFVPLPDGEKLGPGVKITRTHESALVSPSMAANGAGRTVWVSGNATADVSVTPEGEAGPNNGP